MKVVLRRALVIVAAAVLMGPTSVAFAQPEAPGAVSSVDHIEKISDRRWDVHVYSASMDRVIPLQVLRPADTSAPRPTLYMLNGAGGGEDGAATAGGGAGGGAAGGRGASRVCAARMGSPVAGHTARSAGCGYQR